MSDLIGKTLGKYQIIVRLGRGGMARVYKAYQPGLDRYVAVKVLHHHLAEESGFVNRFEREATAVARLRHPNIVQVYDYDNEGQMYYMVMEYVEGPTLKAEMEERQKALEPGGTPEPGVQDFTLAEVATIFTSLAEAIDYAHTRGMIHRDLKPANIMFTPGGEVMLTDFGLSRMMDGTRYTQTGSISGTPAYMAPEQCQGEQGDERSDIYSLGVILYEMITGRVPFDADTPYALMMKHISDAAASPSLYKPGLPPAVEQVIFKALAKEPAERYQSASEMAADLRTAVGLTTGPRAQALFAPIAGIPLVHESTPTPGGSRDGEHLPSTARLAVSSPYRGLYAFREEDATFFFGRETFTDRLVHTIQQKNMAAVIGPSGSGKSSVIYAGLIPHLRQEGKWTIVEMRPGSRPFYALAAALIPYLEPDLSETEQLVEAQKLAHVLRQDQVALLDVAQRILQKQPENGRLLLFIDQFEELYTLCPDPAVRATFPNYLFQAVQKDEGGRQKDEKESSDSSFILHPSSLCLVLTLRADFMGQALTDRPFADALQDADVKLGPMTRAELARAIESPAGKQGVIFESGLAERILDDVGNEPGNLPLLEFALTLLWDRRSGRRLTHSAYEAIGRVEGSLARYADEVYQALSDPDKERARRVFTQMVRPGEGTEDTRRLATRSELGENDWALAQRLADARLVVTGRTPDGEETAEVVHEALIRGWGLLRQWMSNDRTFRAWQERLRAAIRQWEGSERDEGALLRGAPLSEAEDWMNRQGHDLTKIEREFVQASISLREQRAVEREAQRQRELAAARQLADEQKQRADEQAASSRRLRALTSVLAVVFVIAVFAALFALGQRQDAVAAQQAAEQEADARATEVLVRSTAEANAEENASLAITREAEALNAQATAEAERLRADEQAEQALAAQEEAEVERDRADAEAQLALSRQLAVQSGTFLNSQPDLGLLTAVQANTISDTVETRSSILTALQFNPQLYTYLRGHSGLVQGLDFSPSGQWMASVGAAGEVYLWDVATWQRTRTLSGHDPTQLVNSTAFSPDSLVLATASDDLTAILWEVETGQIVHRLVGHTEFVQDIAYSPDGTMVATAAGDNTVRLWDTTSGQEIAVLEGHTDQVWSVAFSPDGRYLASGSADTFARLWDVASRQPIGDPLDMQATAGQVYNLAFSPDSRVLAATAPGAQPNPPTVWLWDVATRQPIGQPLTGHVFGVLGLAFSPDGNTIATSSIDTSVQLWDVSALLAGQAEAATTTAVLNGHQTNVPALAISPDSQFLATGEGNGTIIVWDFSGRHGLSRPFDQGHTAPINALAYDPSSQTVASAAGNGQTLLWDVSGSPTLNTILTHTADVNLALTGLTFDPTGQFLVGGRANGNLLAWDVISSTEVLSPFISHLQGDVAVAFSPDGQTFASGTINGNIILRNGQLAAAGGFLAGHDGPINALAFSPDSLTLASASEDGTIRLWDATTSDPLDSLSHNNIPVTSLAFAPAGNLLASADSGGTIRLWDWTSGQPISQPLQLHNQPVLTLRFSDDGQKLYSADATGVIVEWDIASASALEGVIEVGPDVTRLAFTPNGAQLIAGNGDGNVNVWQVATSELALPLTGHTTPITSLALTQDGRTLAAGDESGAILVWELAEGQQLAGPLTSAPAILNVIDLSYTADGRYLATAANDSSILIWDTSSGQPIGPPIFNGYAGANDLELSPDGQTLALGSCGHFEVRLGCNLGRIYFWDVASGQLQATVEAHVSVINTIAFSPDGRWLISGGCANTDVAGACILGGVYRWDLSTNPPTGELLREFGFAINQVTFSPDGSLLMVAGGNIILLLDAVSGQPIGQSLSGHTGGLNSAAFSPDGRYLASSSCANFAPQTGCTLGEIILWDVASGQPIGNPLLGHNQGVAAVAFSNDSQTLVSAAFDGTILLWDIDPDHWRTMVCRIANRDLSLSEWQRFFGDEPQRPTCS
jgi:WD40 repeat protein/serine/threonine protein kinase